MYRFNSYLLSFTVAFILVGHSQASPDLTTVSGDTATSQGDQSSGISSGTDFTGAVTTLRVESLSGDIVPISGIDGIFFDATTSATIQASMGTNSIRLSGLSNGIKANALNDIFISNDGTITSAVIGIEGYSTGGNIRIENSGELFAAEERGISAYTESATGSAEIINTANVQSYDKGLFAFGDASASVQSTGDITSMPLYNSSATGRSIDVQSNEGTATATSTGRIKAFGTAIQVLGDESANITSNGDITSDSSNGLHAQILSFGDALPGTVQITSNGNINAAEIGIFAYGKNGVTVDSTGSILSSSNDAINVYSFSGSTNISSDGDLTSGSRGIMSYLQSTENAGANNITTTGNVSSALTGIQTYVYGDDSSTRIDHTGDIVSSQGSGIVAQSFNSSNGAVTQTTIINRGNVTAQNEGIQANANDGSLVIDHRGNVTSRGSKAIEGQTFYSGDVLITSVGNINGEYEGIFASSGYGSANSETKVESTGDVSANLSNGGIAINAINYSVGGTATIDSRGNLRSNAVGLQALALNDNSTAIVNSVGNIEAGTRAILAQAAAQDGSAGVAQITSAGKINVVSGTALLALGTDQATITQDGDVTILQGGHAIHAQTVGSVDGGYAEVDFSGNIDALNSVGILAKTDASATVKSLGSITTLGDAIVVNKGEAAFEQTNPILYGGDLLIDHNGSIDAGNRGIIATNFSTFGADTTTIRSVGTIQSGIDGVIAYAENSVSSVTHTGDIFAVMGRGIQSYGDQGATLTSDGAINSSSEAISVLAPDGSASAVHTGDVASTNSRGIVVEAGGGSANLVSRGNVNSYYESVKVYASGSASAEHTGNVMSSASRGIEVKAGGGSASLVSRGNIQSDDVSLFVHANGGNARLDQMGNVDSMHSRGVEVYNSGLGSAELKLQGDVTTSGLGIQAVTEGSGVVIDVTGDTSSGNYGIYAQSNGGVIDIDVVGNIESDGRAAIFAVNTGGSVTVDVSGGVFRSTATDNELDADGVFVEGTGNNTVNISADAVLYGGSDSEHNFGVQFVGGSTNTLTNRGLISDALGGQSVGGETGDDVIENFGTISGSFYLGAGMNAFNNRDSALLNMGGFSSVGAGNSLNNQGNLSPMGVGTIGVSELEGDFIQESTGNFYADVDFVSGQADLLSVQTGGTATVDGMVSAKMSSMGTSLEPQTFTVINAPTGVVDNGITGNRMGALVTTVVTDEDSVDIVVSMDLTVGNTLGGLQDMGNVLQINIEETLPIGLSDSAEQFYLDLMNANDSFDDALASTSPIGQAAVVSTGYISAINFSDLLFSCPNRDGVHRFNSEADGAWGVARGWTYDHDTSGEIYDYDANSFSIAGGVQRAVSDVWVLGIAGGYEDGEIDSFQTGLEYDHFNLGLAAKGQWGAYKLGGALSGGFGTVDSVRIVTIPDAAIATGSRDTSHLDATIRGSYTIEKENRYFTATVAGGATYFSVDAFAESGAGVSDLSVDEISEWIGRGSLIAEIGSENIQEGGTLIRPFLSASLTGLTSDSVDVVSSMEGLGIGSFSVSSEMDSVFCELRAGAHVLGTEGLNLRLEYGGRFSSNSIGHSLIFKGSFAF